MIIQLLLALDKRLAQSEEAVRPVCRHSRLRWSPACVWVFFQPCRAGPADWLTELWWWWIHDHDARHHLHPSENSGQAYDPLNRLISTTYSTPSTGSGQAGESFGYQYDAVGNRTAMTTTEGTTTYQYDAANRLTSAGGVSYTWDARGNLVSDGTFTYTYNAAGRMVQAESVTLTLVYTYTSAGLSAGNAAGLRVAESVDGDVTTFAWDWASGIPEMLSESGDLYLIGHETLGQWDGSEWVYYLPDALGSIRQATNDTGAVTDSREWTPFGVEVDTAQAGLGYTGEWFDDSAGMVYLRARWYDDREGRFTQPDAFFGSIRLPSSLHQYVYVRNTPILLTDPSGLIPPPPYPPPPPSLHPDMTVGELIEFFEWVYDKNGFLMCDSMPDDDQHFTDTAWDLFVDFVCERGPVHRHFNAYDYLTKELAQSSLIHDIRQRFYEGDATPIPRTEVEFGPGGFLQATLDNLVAGYSDDFIRDWPGSGNGRVIAWHALRHANITHLMGSFDYEVSLINSAMVKLVVTNYTERASGSHFPGRFKPEYDQYLESLVHPGINEPPVYAANVRPV